MITTISVQKEQADEFHRQKRLLEAKENKSLSDWEYMERILNKTKVSE